MVFDSDLDLWDWVQANLIGVKPPVCRLRAVNRPPLIQEFKHVAFMRLVPADLHGADRTNIEAIDQFAFHQLVHERVVSRDGGDDEAVADLGQHLFLRPPDHAGLGAEERTIVKRVVGALDLLPI